MVEQWRNGMATALKSHNVDDFDWREKRELPYFTDKPAWDCYGHLLLWAAYSERPEVQRPTEFMKNWDKDPVYLASTKQGSGSKYPQLLSNVEWWLPAKINFTFRAPSVNGKQIMMGSSYALLNELRELNANTWKADDKQISSWRSAGCPDHGSPLEQGACFAFAVMYELSKEAIEHRLPMLLDY